MSDQHTTVQYQLRLPQELRDKIKESASTYNRSMNADIIARLEDSFETPSNEDSELTLEEQLNQVYQQNDVLMQSIKLLREEMISNTKYLQN